MTGPEARLTPGDLADHLRSVVGQRLSMPGGKGTPFVVVDVGDGSVLIRSQTTDFSIPVEWVQRAWDRLLSRGELVRSGLGSTIAQYRSGYIFAIIASHPAVVVAKPFPTRLTVPRGDRPSALGADKT